MRRSILALVAIGFAFTIPLRAQADQTIIQRDITQGPAQVMGSWMEPAYERVRETTNADGTTHQVREPIIMERHERVVVPFSEQRTTTTVVNAPRVETQTAYRAARPVARKKVAYKRRAVAYKKRYRAPRVAHVRRSPSNLIAVKTVRKIQQPTIIQRTDHYEQENLIYDRRHPALDM
ncbi:MAG: hypothetical protein K2Y39_00340 [Candidatus Obscuribacterales bacterium]|nr:hypothetical protein [Candidatus Obscuribacterales bacterium]